MRFMELRQLRSFVAVAEELHFRRAADRPHLAQPSVSQQIRTLEAELGVRLFERNRRGAVLTPAGSALLGEARDLLSRADRAAAVVARHRRRRARSAADEPDAVADRRGRRRDRLRLPVSIPRGRAGPQPRYDDAPRRATSRRRDRRRLRPPAARGSGARRAGPRARADGVRAPSRPPADAAHDRPAARICATSRSYGGPKNTDPAPGGRSAARSAAIPRGRRSRAPSPRRSGS